MSKSTLELHMNVFEDSVVSGILKSNSCPKDILIDEYYKRQKDYKYFVDDFFSSITDQAFFEYVMKDRKSYGISILPLSIPENEIISNKSIALKLLKERFYKKPDFTRHPFAKSYDFELLKKYFDRFEACCQNKKLPLKQLKHLMKTEMVPEYLENDIEKRSKNSKKRYNNLVRNNFFEKVYNNVCDLFSDNPELHKKIKSNLYLTGSSIYCKIHKIKVKDYDFFIKDLDVAKEILEYMYNKNHKSYVWKNSINTNKELEMESMINGDISSLKIKNMQGLGQDNFEYSNEEKIHTIISPNAVTLNFKMPIEGTQFCEDVKIQIITRSIGNPKSVTRSFDFEHCKIAIDFHKKKVYSSFLTDVAIERKYLLSSKKSKVKLDVFKRVANFMERGMILPLHSQVNLFKKIQNQKIDKEFVLENMGFYDQELENEKDELQKSSSLDEFLSQKTKRIFVQDLNMNNMAEILQEVHNKKNSYIADPPF